MRIISRLLILVIICFGTNILFGQLNNNVWEDFIKKPVFTRYLLCEKQIGKDFPNASWNDELFPYLTDFWDKGNYGHLLNLAESGNDMAIALCFQLIPHLKGSWLEDVYITIQNSTMNDPVKFLYFFDRYYLINGSNVIDKDQLSSFIFPIGDRYIDEVDLTLKEINNRIILFRSLDIEQYNDLIQTCIDILLADKEWLENIIKQLK